jgi:hypothetical protein
LFSDAGAGRVSGALGEDIKEVYAEAKGTGFEPKIMRQLIKIRKMDKTSMTSRKACSNFTSGRSECCRTRPPRLRSKRAE